MGTLIQTKGTRRLADWFNSRFNNNNIAAARSAQTNDATPLLLKDAFRNGSLDLLAISDAFIAHKSGASWPGDGDDLLYPSATLIPLNTGSATSTLNFQAGAAGIPASIKPGSAVISLDRKSIPHNVIVSSVTNTGGGAFTVALQKGGNPKAVTVNAGERISFAQQSHEQLVRRWRWYLKYDLKSENHAAIRRAISAVLDDLSFNLITFQAIEDAQRVFTNVEPLLNPNSLEFDDKYNMQIVLLTNQTTSPDPIDQQN